MISFLLILPFVGLQVLLLVVLLAVPLPPHRVQLVLRACTPLEWLRLFVSQLRFCVSWFSLHKEC